MYLNSVLSLLNIILTLNKTVNRKLKKYFFVKMA